MMKARATMTEADAARALHAIATMVGGYRLRAVMMLTGKDLTTVGIALYPDFRRWDHGRRVAGNFDGEDETWTWQPGDTEIVRRRPVEMGEPPTYSKTMRPSHTIICGDMVTLPERTSHAKA